MLEPKLEYIRDRKKAERILGDTHKYTSDALKSQGKLWNILSELI